jgi:predicted nucleic acid-binding protein
VKTRVLDSWPILEWISGERLIGEGTPGECRVGDIVAALLSDAEHGRVRLLISAIDVGEVYYFLRKHHSLSLAESWRDTSATLPATIEVPTAQDIWSAATLKGQFPISYADAFAAALAQKYNCPLVTGDPEFRSVDQLELDWIAG